MNTASGVAQLLLIADDPADGDSFRRALDAGGYDVRQARSFIDSLDAIEPEPDAIVLVGLAVFSYPGQEAPVLRVPAQMTPDALVAEVHRRLSLRATLLTTLAQAA